MSRKAQTVLPDALTKGDYFRTRGPSRSPSRRPPRKGALKADASGKEPAKSPSNDVRLPQIGGSSGSGSDKSDRTQNGDPMLGEITVAFIDYRPVGSSLKRGANADPMHNVKIIQYIGQGKGGTRNTHEFWMQSETAAKFPVAQQAISSRLQLNFAFYLDGQFFHRLSVCCLNKMRTNHFMIGTKLVHFKVVDCTNVVMCYRCKGHEFMLQSFKRSSSQPRSASVPRRQAEPRQTVNGSSPNATEQKGILRVDGATRRARSISRPRGTTTKPNGTPTPPAEKPPPPLQRTNTKTLVKAGAAGAAAAGLVNGMTNGIDRSATLVNGNSSRRPSLDDDALENYCADRMSPDVTKTQIRDTEIDSETGAPKPDEEPNTKGMGSHGDSVFPHNVPPVEDDDVDETNDTADGTVVREADENTPALVRQASGEADNGDTVTQVRDSEEPKTEDNTATEVRDSEPESTETKTETDVRQSDPEPVTTTEVRDAPEETSTEVRDASPPPAETTEVSSGSPETRDEPETQTEVREAQDTDTQVREAQSEPTEDTELESAPQEPQKTQPLRENPNVDTAEDMIELGHQRPVSVLSQTNEITGQRPRRASTVSATGEAAGLDEITGQRRGSLKKNYSIDQGGEVKWKGDTREETETQIRDSKAEVPSLAKEDPVAFDWPDTKPAGDAPEEARPDSSAAKGNFEWPDAAEPGLKSRQISVDIVDDADGPTQETKTQVRDAEEEPAPSRKSSVPPPILSRTRASRDDGEPVGKPPPSSPHNAEELLEQLGYGEDGTEQHPTATVAKTPRLNHIGASQSVESVDSMADVEMTDSARQARIERKRSQKPPPSPHTAGEFIDQLGYDINEPEPKYENN